MDDHNYFSRSDQLKDDKSCALCHKEFQKRKKGSKSVYRYTISSLRPGFELPLGNFVCGKCRYRVLKDENEDQEELLPCPKVLPARFNFNEHSYCRYTAEPRPERKPSSTPVPGQKMTANRFKNDVINCIFRGKYDRAIKLILESTNRYVKLAVRRQIGKATKKELNNAPSSLKESLWTPKFSQGTLDSFSWSAAISQAEKAMPISCSALSGLMPSMSTIGSRLSFGRKGRKR